VHGVGWNRRGPSARPASGKDRWYKPMVKSSGGQRESEGAVVPLIGVQHNAPGGKGPHFDHAGGEGKREGMAGTARSNSPGRCEPAVAVLDQEPQQLLAFFGAAGVVQRLRRLMIKKRGRNLHAGQAGAWNEEWFNGHGLYRLRGTVRYPKAA
jgi:hypothetical protein